MSLPADIDLSALAARLPARPRTRFAPAPTGYLHLGHVVNANYVWGVARALGGTVLLRIEDHDRTRCRPEYEAALLEDLAWLGLVPDEGWPRVRGDAAATRATGLCRQSDDGEVYAAAARRLAADGRVYVCDCSRRDIAEAGGATDGEPRYPGRCRERGLPDGPGRGLRVRLDPGVVEEFDDARLGVQRQDPSAQCGDVLIRDRNGCWTYQFCVVVDDLRQGIDLVIRGEDLLASTGRQIQLARLLGRTSPPVFLHHPLLVHADGRKLSKSNRDTGVRELRAAGARLGSGLISVSAIGGESGTFRLHTNRRN